MCKTVVSSTQVFAKSSSHELTAPLGARHFHARLGVRLLVLLLADAKGLAIDPTLPSLVNLGNKQQNVTNALSMKSGMESGAVADILKVAAPIVMGFLGKQQRQR